MFLKPMRNPTVPQTSGEVQYIQDGRIPSPSSSYSKIEIDSDWLSWVSKFECLKPFLDQKSHQIPVFVICILHFVLFQEILQNPTIVII